MSYPNEEQDIVENLRTYLKIFGVNAWIYSLDRTLAEAVWPEIENKISDSDLVLFVVSQATLNADGQLKELDFALKKVDTISGESKIMPLFITGTKVSDCPLELRTKNGIFFDTHTVKSAAFKITERVFPVLMTKEKQRAWKYPIPGEWLEVSNLDEVIETYFDIGDKLYFRAISPMALFECFSPKTEGLFWIAPENVKISYEIKSDNRLENQIPRKFKKSGMIDIQILGWEAWRKSQK